MLNNYEWWLTGGESEIFSNEGTTTSEIYDLRTGEVRPYIDLPIKFWKHSVVKVQNMYFIPKLINNELVKKIMVAVETSKSLSQIDGDTFFIIGGSSSPVPVYGAWIFHREIDDFEEVDYPFGIHYFNLGTAGVILRAGQKEVVVSGNKEY